MKPISREEFDRETSHLRRNAAFADAVRYCRSVRRRIAAHIRQNGADLELSQFVRIVYFEEADFLGELGRGKESLAASIHGNKIAQQNQNVTERFQGYRILHFAYRRMNDWDNALSCLLKAFDISASDANMDYALIAIDHIIEIEKHLEMVNATDLCKMLRRIMLGSATRRRRLS